MSGHEGRGWGAKRGRTMTGVKMAGIEKKGGKHLSLKPACTLPEGMLREGFVGEKNSQQS